MDVIPGSRPPTSLAVRLESVVRVECDCRRIVVGHIENEPLYARGTSPSDDGVNEHRSDTLPSELWRDPHGNQRGAPNLNRIASATDHAHVYVIVNGDERRQVAHLLGPLLVRASIRLFKRRPERIG